MRPMVAWVSTDRPLIRLFNQRARGFTSRGIMSTSRHFVAPLAKSHARAMRREPTDAERTLWYALRDRRLASLKWRRQFPIGEFIVDFVCLEHRMIVECDGSQHAENPRDAARDAWLRSQGFEIARFWNHEVLRERESVIDTILSRCRLPW
jgi:very-short-patch-repair endonuclease